MKYEINVNCCFCSAETKHSIELPAGWAHRIGAIDDEDDGFCPKHAKVEEFTQSQCPGCVSGWGDCELWRAFAHSRSRTITDEQLQTIENGVCPFRVNGTISFSPGRGVESIDLSEHAPAEAGKATAKAIREYIEAWP